MNWTYDQSDPALMLFTAAVERFGIDFRPGSRVLELGCAETDFLERLHKADPSLDLVGVDVRRDRDANGWTQVVGSGMDASLFPPASFDAVVLLGALEHFGLGFYGDPVDDAGDMATMFNVTTWLRPGGWAYFDVPCQPTYGITENRHFRYYSPASIKDRFFGNSSLMEVARGYSLPEPSAGTWIDEPTQARVPYHFVAVLARKEAA